MEDPAVLLDSILAWASDDARVSGVVQTGSLARGRRVDAFSDLDLELIGPVPGDLASDESWIQNLGEVMVTLALENDGPGQLGWPTRLVVFGQGRKVDFTLAGHQRILAMTTEGLDGLYDHGYLVHLDKDGDLSQLPPSRFQPPPARRPTQEEFSSVESEFWFEVTQIAVYLVRRDLWVAKFREHTARTCLLNMLEWFAESDPVSPTYTWHLGHHIDEWLPEPEWEAVQQIFTHIDVPDTLRGLAIAMDQFAEVSAVVADRNGLKARADLPDRVRRHLAATVS